MVSERKMLVGIRERWRTALDDPERRTPGIYVEPLGLGVTMRLKLLVLACNMTQEQFYENMIPTPDQTLRRSLQRVFNLNDISQPSDQILTASLDVYRRFVSCNAEESGLIFKETFKKPSAVDDFLEWLRGGCRKRPIRRSRREDYSLIRDWDNINFLYSPEDERARELASVLRFLRLSPDISRDSFKLVKLIVGKGMPRGLRAFGKEIIGRLADQSRDILYLPIFRCASSGRRITYRDTVSSVATFCEDNELSSSIELNSADDVRAAIKIIRRRMALRPIILIFCGWPGDNTAFPGLERYIRNDGLIDIVQEIVRPWLGDEVTDPSVFYDNRIIILGEGPIVAGGGFPDENQYFRDSTVYLSPPPPRAMLSILKKYHSKNEEQLKKFVDRPEFRRDATLSVINDILLIDPDIDFNPSASEDVFNTWVAVLSKQRKIDLIIANFVSLSPDGLRISTLMAIVRAWCTLVSKEEAALDDLWPSLHEPPEAEEVELAIQQMVKREIISFGQDSIVPGLERHHSWRSYGEFETNWDVYRAPEVLLFHTALQRTEHLRVLLRSKSLARTGAYLALAHRLIAEICLEHHTRILQHSEWVDIQDAGHYRRLVQALYHGFSSLVGQRKLVNPKVGETYGCLPGEWTDAYTQLYSIYYRAIIESPPNWDLARTLGREDIKGDLLLLSMCVIPDEKFAWQAVHGLSGNIKIKNIPRRESAIGPTIIRDQLLSYARVRYFQSEYEEANEAIKQIKDGPLSELRDTSFMPGDASINKLEADIALAAAMSRGSDILDTVTSALQSSSFDISLLRSWEGAVTNEWVYGGGETATGWVLESYCREEGVKLVGSATPEMLALWSDLLCRYAEAKALDYRTADNRAELLITSLLILKIGEELRLQAFSAAPLARTFYVNGHSMRTLVRTLLTLLEYNLEGNEDIGRKAFPSVEYMVMEARNHIDMAITYLARWPAERASLLILESAFLRRRRSIEKKMGRKIILMSTAIEDADDLLMGADLVIGVSIHRPRVIMRLTHERCKLYWELMADCGREDNLRRSNFILRFRYEVLRFEWLAATEAARWKKEAENWRERLFQLQDLSARFS